MEKLLNNSEWVQTVWVWGSRCSDAWFFLKSWLQNVSAHHNWRSFLSILMFAQENGKHIEQFRSCKFARYFFSSEVACVSFNDGWNASVCVNFVWAPNDPKSLYFHFHFYSFLQRSPPRRPPPCTRAPVSDPWRHLEYIWFQRWWRGRWHFRTQQLITMLAWWAVIRPSPEETMSTFISCIFNTLHTF